MFNFEPEFFKGILDIIIFAICTVYYISESLYKYVDTTNLFEGSIFDKMWPIRFSWK